MSEAEARRTGPLADVRILDCTQALAGPFGTT
jgi:crotonobetainyl-CoA:carnitine CoA-transferase CaiB-like acyl-CoA transferase